MTTTDEAYAAAGLLIGGIPGFGFDDEVVLKKFIEQLRDNFPDGDALTDVCRDMSMSWTGKTRPSMHDIKMAYQDHPAVREVRETRLADARLADIGKEPWCEGTGWIHTASDTRSPSKPCHRCNPVLYEIFRDSDKWNRYLHGTPAAHLQDVFGKDFVMPPSCKRDSHHDPERIVGFEEGQAIMNDAYREATGHDIGVMPRGNPTRAEQAIRDVGYQDRQGHWKASFQAVLAEFGDNQALCRASLDALGPRLTDVDYGGTLILGGPPQPLQPLSHGRGPVPAAPVTPETADGPTEPQTAHDRSMADALAETARLLGERP